MNWTPDEWDEDNDMEYEERERNEQDEQHKTSASDEETTPAEQVREERDRNETQDQSLMPLDKEKIDSIVRLAARLTPSEPCPSPSDTDRSLTGGRLMPSHDSRPNSLRTLHQTA